MKRKIAVLLVLLVLLLGSTAQAAVQTAPVAAKKEVTVYVATDSGEKYHKNKKCRSLKKSKSIVAYKLSECPVEYDPCKICKPSKR